MAPSRFFSGLLAASMALSSSPAAALAVELDSASSASSSSSVSAEVDARTTVRIERCKRFAKGDDYERCVRLIKRLPERERKNTSPDETPAEATAESDPNGWKWTNILNRMEAKVKSMIKLVSVMGKSFCKDRTSENETTSRECMGRLKDELKTRIDRILNEVFRGDLPSSR